MTEFNIIATVGTSETDLAPYPGGSSSVPSAREGRYTRWYWLIVQHQPTP